MKRGESKLLEILNVDKKELRKVKSRIRRVGDYIMIGGLAVGALGISYYIGKLFYNNISKF